MMIPKEETLICKLCLEPVYNFICIDCQRDSVLKFLEENDKKLINDFTLFHKKLSETFSTEQNTMKCIKCLEMKETTICPHCYAKEVFLWLLERNQEVAEKFSRTFNYDFLNTGYTPGVIVNNLTPIILCEKHETSEQSICDKCGEPSDDLKEINGEWLCESCRED